MDGRLKNHCHEITEPAGVAVLQLGRPETALDGSLALPDARCDGHTVKDSIWKSSMNFYRTIIHIKWVVVRTKG